MDMSDRFKEFDAKITILRDEARAASLAAIILLSVIGSGCGTQTQTTNSNIGIDRNASNTPANSNAMQGVNGNTNGMQGTNPGNMDHSMKQSSSNAATAPYDLQFLDTMAAHHQAAVEMAGLCSTKAQHADVRALCANIISSQLREISQMKSWRDQWFAGKAPALNMEMTGMQDSMKGMDMKTLSSLNGNDFDLAFIKQMIPHHEGAVVMAKEALQRSTKPEIKTLANAIIKAQEAEIKQMKEWQAAWTK